MFGTAEPGEDIGLFEAVQVDDKVELARANVACEFYDPRDRTELCAVAELDAVYRYDVIRELGKTDDLSRGLSCKRADLCIGKSLADRAKGRQRKHDVAELAEVNYENVFEVGLSLSQAAILHQTRRSWPLISKGVSMPRRLSTVGATSASEPFSRRRVDCE
jgi:hypothetical protein